MHFAARERLSFIQRPGRRLSYELTEDLMGREFLCAGLRTGVGGLVGTGFAIGSQLR